MDKTAEDANQKHGHVDLSETSKTQRQDTKTYFKDTVHDLVSVSSYNR